MQQWKTTLLALASKLEHSADKAKRAIKTKIGRLDPLIVQPYRGYGNEEEFYLTGRVLEEEGLALPEEKQSRWQNLKTMYRRYESDELPDAQVKINVHETDFHCRTDQEGYFQLRTELPNLKETIGCWHPVNYTLSSHLDLQENDTPFEVSCSFQKPTHKTRQVIISDIDDTIVISKATEFLEKLKILMLSNARSRKPFAGVAAFYRALAKGRQQNEENMFFYLSSSSWNLYDLFDRFCEINQLPKGCFLLRDVGLDKSKLYRSSHGDHKLGHIRRLFLLYPSLKFTLIGDSGQHDPEIYQKVAREFPQQISAIYIRDVKPETSNRRDAEVHTIAQAMEALGVRMKLVKNSLEAAEDAATAGLISRDSLREIQEDTTHDETMAEEEEEQGIKEFLGISD